MPYVSEIAMINELLDLFLGVITLDEKMVLCKRAVYQAGIPGQDCSILLECTLNDLVVVQGMIVKDVVPEEAHALCKLAQHDIGNKLHYIHHKDSKTLRKARELVC